MTTHSLWINSDGKIQLAGDGSSIAATTYCTCDTSLPDGPPCEYGIRGDLYVVGYGYITSNAFGNYTDCNNNLISWGGGDDCNLISGIPGCCQVWASTGHYLCQDGGGECVSDDSQAGNACPNATNYQAGNSLGPGYIEMTASGPTCQHCATCVTCPACNAANCDGAYDCGGVPGNQEYLASCPGMPSGCTCNPCKACDTSCPDCVGAGDVARFRDGSGYDCSTFSVGGTAGLSDGHCFPCQCGPNSVDSDTGSIYVSYSGSQTCECIAGYILDGSGNCVML